MKGSVISLFKIGDFVSFATANQIERLGRIIKLHKSARSGVAEIRPADGKHKVSRRLIHVKKVDEK